MNIKLNIKIKEVVNIRRITIFVHSENGEKIVSGWCLEAEDTATLRAHSFQGLGCKILHNAINEDGIWKEKIHQH